MVEQKLFSLEYLDSSFKKLNLRPFDGDMPSILVGVSLDTCDSNLCQHGQLCGMHIIYTYKYKYAYRTQFIP